MSAMCDPTGSGRWPADSPCGTHGECLLNPAFLGNVTRALVTIEQERINGNTITPMYVCVCDQGWSSVGDMIYAPYDYCHISQRTLLPMWIVAFFSVVIIALIYYRVVRSYLGLLNGSDVKKHPEKGASQLSHSHRNASRSARFSVFRQAVVQRWSWLFDNPTRRALAFMFVVIISFATLTLLKIITIALHFYDTSRGNSQIVGYSAAPTFFYCLASFGFLVLSHFSSLIWCASAQAFYPRAEGLQLCKMTIRSILIFSTVDVIAYLLPPIACAFSEKDLAHRSFWETYEILIALHFQFKGLAPGAALATDLRIAWKFLANLRSHSAIQEQLATKSAPTKSGIGGGTGGGQQNSVIPSERESSVNISRSSRGFEHHQTESRRGTGQASGTIHATGSGGVIANVSAKSPIASATSPPPTSTPTPPPPAAAAVGSSSIASIVAAAASRNASRRSTKNSARGRPHSVAPNVSGPPSSARDHVRAASVDRTPSRIAASTHRRNLSVEVPTNISLGLVTQLNAANGNNVVLPTTNSNTLTQPQHSNPPSRRGSISQVLPIEMTLQVHDLAPSGRSTPTRPITGGQFVTSSPTHLSPQAISPRSPTLALPPKHPASRAASDATAPVITDHRTDGHNRHTGGSHSRKPSIELAGVANIVGPSAHVDPSILQIPGVVTFRSGGGGRHSGGHANHSNNNLTNDMPTTLNDDGNNNHTINNNTNPSSPPSPISHSMSQPNFHTSDMLDHDLNDITTSVLTRHTSEPIPTNDNLIKPIATAIPITHRPTQVVKPNSRRSTGNGALAAGIIKYQSNANASGSRRPSVDGVVVATVGGASIAPAPTHHTRAHSSGGQDREHSVSHRPSTAGTGPTHAVKSQAELQAEHRAKLTAFTQRLQKHNRTTTIIAIVWLIINSVFAWVPLLRSYTPYILPMQVMITVFSIRSFLLTLSPKGSSSSSSSSATSPPVDAPSSKLRNGGEPSHGRPTSTHKRTPHHVHKYATEGSTTRQHQQTTTQQNVQVVVQTMQQQQQQPHQQQQQSAQLISPASTSSPVVVMHIDVAATHNFPN